MAEKTIKSEFYKTQDQQPALGIGEKWLELRYDPVTGDTRLYEYNIIGGVVGKKEKVYENGSWEYDPGAVTSVSEKVKVNDLVKDIINRLKGDPRNIIPAFVSQDAPSQDIGSSGTPVPSANSSGLSGVIGQVLGGTLDITPDQFGTDMTTLFTEYPDSVLKYPIDIIDSHQDTLRITQYQYQAPYGDVFKGKQKDDIFKLGAQRQSALKKRIASVRLPIPNNVADTNAVNWGNGNEMNSMTMGVAGNMGAVAGSVLTEKVISAIASAKGANGIANALSGGGASNVLSNLITGALDNPTAKAAAMSNILKAALFDVPAETILSRGYGVVSNSNLELLFSGPILRSFQFGYMFSPRSEEEAKMCRKIIRFFKQGMATKKTKSIGAGTASFLLSTPNVFKLEYKTEGDKDIKGLNKFKICALSNMQTSYADGQWSAYKEGQPVRTQMMLTFKELEPVYESDYQDTLSKKLIGTIDGKYLDQPSVGPDEIGF
jgi:hypothetical protein